MFRFHIYLNLGLLTSLENLRYQMIFVINYHLFLFFDIISTNFRHFS